jgi:hypothetical protein
MNCWAVDHIKKLSNGVDVWTEVKNDSMAPLMKKGQQIIIWNTGVFLYNNNIYHLKEGTIVLCKIHGKHVYRKIYSRHGARYKVSDASNKLDSINTTLGLDSIYGVIIQIDKVNQVWNK